MIREATEQDYAQIKALHETDGFSYVLPDLGDSHWLRRIVIEEAGEVVAAGLGMLSAEAFLMLKPSSRTRMARRFAIIEAEAIKAIGECGLRGLHAWVAPTVEQKFGAQLLGRGWSKPLWPAYERVIRE